MFVPFCNPSSMEIKKDNDTLTFQCKDIVSRDVFDKSTEKKNRLRRFQIQIFGTNAEGQSVCLQVNGFRPFFYVRLPEKLPVPARHTFIQWIYNSMTSEEADKSSVDYETHKTLMDFNNGETSPFLKITVPSQALWRKLKDRFLTKTSEPIVYEYKQLFGIPGEPIGLRIYEANIDPVLRFFHIQNLSPAGWVKVCDWEHETESNDSKTDVSITADWEDVLPSEEGSMAPFLIASWDIECNSSHGDFPLAKKTWRKPIRDMADAFKTKTNKLTIEAMCTFLASYTAVGSDALLTRIREKGKEGKGKEQGIQACLQDLNEEAIQALDKLLVSVFPRMPGDEIIQIGTVLYKRGAPVSKHIWVLGTVDEAAVRPPGIDVPIHVHGCRDEATLLEAWFAWIGRSQPDVMIGYNIFGFDSKYIWDRLEETVPSQRMAAVVAPLSCLRTRPSQLEEKFLSSSAMGDNTMWFMSSPGRLQIDLLPYIRRNHNLDSYSLDNVSATFVSGSVSGLTRSSETQFYFTTSTKGIVAGRYITLMDEENDRVVPKCLVVDVRGKEKKLVIEIPGGQAALDEHGSAPVRWAQTKDDVHPKDIFRLHRGTAHDRAIVARYCLQDCDLVMELFHKLEILANSVAMANVCSVPVSYIFLRGQGIKIESLIFRECRRVDQLIEVLPSQEFREVLEEADAEKSSDGGQEQEQERYEGAIVLDPKTGVYVDDPITADDFASLYPSSIISENISHDTLISVKDYDMDGNFVLLREGSDTYDNLPGASYVNIEFDILRPDPEDTRKHKVALKTGTRIARYIQKPQGTIPRILEMLLASRKTCRKLAEKEPDEFRKALLDAQQLAYKLTANSLYGQLGSATFKIRRQVLAASTTAYGRKQLMYAKTVIETVYGGGKDPRCDVECIYGDTDSIFLRFRPKDPATGKRLHGHAALVAAKDLTIESGKLVSSCLKPPHDFEFDKIFRSFCLLSKKRYVGDMSEDGLEEADFHRKSMGIVMKRRDNAPIVKYVYRKAIDSILDPASADVASGVRAAAGHVHAIARDLLAGTFPLSKLTITKSLRSEYKDPSRIAHKVLADRIGERDPGNKPSTSDRIPYVYIVPPKGTTLQGDRIELPSYILEKKMAPDYAFYITNQISKPVSQVFGLVVEHIPGVRAAEVSACNKAADPVAAREKLAYKYLFQTVLSADSQRPEVMAARGQMSIKAMFS